MEHLLSLRIVNRIHRGELTFHNDIMTYSSVRSLYCKTIKTAVREAAGDLERQRMPPEGRPSGKASG